MRKFNLILILCIICSRSLIAQDKIKIAGKVQDENGQPIEFANVYINNTSYATSTSSNGEFSLIVPTNMQIELIASFVGFKSKQLELTSNRNYINLTLILSQQMLNEVVVTAKRKGNSKRNMKIFEDAFLGKTWQAHQCKILNPEDIVLTEERAKSELTAYGLQPIIVENRSLGYTVKVNLFDFKTDGKAIYTSSKQFFEEMKPKNEREKANWDKNRSQTYTSSFKNYLVELARNNTKEVEIEIYVMKQAKKVFNARTLLSDEIFTGFLKETEPKEFIVKIDEDNFEYRTEKPHLILLKKFRSTSSPFYDAQFQHSQIVLPKGFFQFNSNGWVTNPNGLFIIGYWGNEALANLLPTNYLPEID